MGSNAFSRSTHLNKIIPWKLTDEIETHRKKTLILCPQYEEIAVGIAKFGYVRRCASEGLKQDKNIRRSKFLLEVVSATPFVDLFHNGSDGYRARYLRRVDVGDSANDFIIDLLRPILIDAWRNWRHRRKEPDWAEKSLAGGKIWIHQGRWALPRYLNRSKTALDIAEWQQHRNDPNAKIRKKVRLGSLCPVETFVTIKGHFLNPDGTIAGNPKSRAERADQIHKFGFT
jgi:hypothetical protein